MANKSVLLLLLLLLLSIQTFGRSVALPFIHRLTCSAKRNAVTVSVGVAVSFGVTVAVAAAVILRFHSYVSTPSFVHRLARSFSLLLLKRHSSRSFHLPASSYFIHEFSFIQLWSSPLSTPPQLLSTTLHVSRLHTRTYTSISLLLAALLIPVCSSGS